jgi:hypothetical protein
MESYIVLNNKNQQGTLRRRGHLSREQVAHSEYLFSQPVVIRKTRPDTDREPYYLVPELEDFFSTGTTKECTASPNCDAMNIFDWARFARRVPTNRVLKQRSQGFEPDRTVDGESHGELGVIVHACLLSLCFVDVFRVQRDGKAELGKRKDALGGRVPKQQACVVSCVSEPE